MIKERNFKQFETLSTVTCIKITSCREVFCNQWDERDTLQKFFDKLFHFKRYFPFDIVYEIKTKANLFHLNDLCEDEFRRVFIVIKIDPVSNILIRTVKPTFIKQNLRNKLIYLIGSTYTE